MSIDLVPMSTSPLPDQTSTQPDYVDPLAKAIADAHAVGQPYRINNSFYSAGAYAGVRDIHTATSVTFKLLRQAAVRNPVIAAIIQKRQGQFARFAKRPGFRNDPGFTIKLKDAKKKPTAEDQKRIDEITEIILNGGVKTPHRRTGELAVWNAEGSRKARGMRMTLKALARDSLVLDAAAIHKEEGQNRKRYPIVWWDAEDGESIRFAIPKDEGKLSVDKGVMVGGFFSPYKPEIRPSIDECAYVKMGSFGRQIVREFSYRELAYLVRNPRTDEWVQGYGLSELETLIDVISGILNGVRFNNQWFDENHIPPGLLSLVGNYAEAELQGLRRQFRTMVGGPGQWWKLPILQAGPGSSSAQYIPMRPDPGNGMYWTEWIKFCATVAAALYQMDATEINFVNFGQSTNSLSNSNPAEKLKYAQETGFETFMADFGDMLNRDVVDQIDPDYMLAWSGLNADDAEQEMEDRASRMQYAMTTPNMERARLDESPIFDPIDKELWDHVRELVVSKLGESATDEEVNTKTAEVYKAAGGQLATWPDAPVGNSSAFQQWQQEHGAAPQVGPDGETVLPGQGGAPAGQSGQAGGPQGSRALPSGGDQEQPGTYDDEGDDTHIADLGSAVLRRQAGNTQAQAEQEMLDRIGKHREKQKAIAGQQARKLRPAAGTSAPMSKSGIEPVVEGERVYTIRITRGGV